MKNSTQRSLKSLSIATLIIGDLFPKSNISLIRWSALVAGLYKMAYLAAKDSKLAI